MNHRTAEIQYLESLLRQEAFVFFESPTITTETNFSDVVTNFCKDFTKENLKEVARYKWDPAKYNPTAETFSDLLKRLKVIAKQAVRENARQCIQTFLLAQLPISIQQELMNSNKEDASTDEIKAFLHRCQQYNQFAQLTLPQPVHQGTTMKNDVKPKTTPQSTNARRMTRFEGKCFYCNKVNHRQAECRQKARDAENGTLFVLKYTKLTHFWTPEQSKVHRQKPKFEKKRLKTRTG